MTVLAGGDHDAEHQHHVGAHHSGGEDLAHVADRADRRRTLDAGQQDAGEDRGHREHRRHQECDPGGRGGAELEQLDAHERDHEPTSVSLDQGGEDRLETVVDGPHLGDQHPGVPCDATDRLDGEVRDDHPCWPSGRTSAPARLRAAASTESFRCRDADLLPAGAEARDRTGRDEPTVVDDDRIVGTVRDLGEQMAGQQHRAAVVGERPQEHAHPLDPGGIESVERLVEHQHLRLADHRGGEVEPLTHAQREATDPSPCCLHETDVGASTSVDPCLGHPGLGCHDPQVVACAPVRVEPLVEHGTDHAQRVRQVPVSMTADER